VELEEQPGLKVTTNMVDAGYDELSCGMPVEVDFREVGPGFVLPMFKPATPEEANR